ncbi:hypothetical protein AKO1_014203 [Acrasis kona]|uniref:Uncharacterized protein n=1 Tax=Acrasis kona TaxID=1008807 RepID=A0AAW2Z2I8_9EUKA
MELLILAGIAVVSSGLAYTGYKCVYVPATTRETIFEDEDEEFEPVNTRLYTESPNYENIYDEESSNFAFQEDAESDLIDTSNDYVTLSDKPLSRTITAKQVLEKEKREELAKIEDQRLASGVAAPIRFDENDDEDDPIKKAIREQQPY